MAILKVEFDIPNASGEIKQSIVIMPIINESQKRYGLNLPYFDFVASIFVPANGSKIIISILATVMIVPAIAGERSATSV